MKKPHTKRAIAITGGCLISLIIYLLGVPMPQQALAALPSPHAPSNGGFRAVAFFMPLRGVAAAIDTPTASRTNAAEQLKAARRA